MEGECVCFCSLHFTFCCKSEEDGVVDRKPRSVPCGEEEEKQEEGWIECYGGWKAKLFGRVLLLRFRLPVLLQKHLEHKSVNLRWNFFDLHSFFLW